MIDMVKITLKLCLFNIYGGSLVYQCFLKVRDKAATLSFPSLDSL